MENELLKEKKNEAGDQLNLGGADAIVKIREIAEGETAMFGVFEGPYDLVSSPMYTQAVDDDGTIWFFSGADSDKNATLATQPEVKLNYYNHGEDAYLAISGTCVVSRDAAVTDRLWSEWTKTWFPNGKEDPNLTLLKVTPKDGNYWESKNGKIESFLKIAFSTLTGAQMDDGREGKIEL
jgi:general stress protein 26